ncbi:DUF433 domain-containing protein [Hymenobacter sp. HMF4947]|uniref:DUF433 domain-containing protein n=1 Tax=Hymenobacter ginkgonis TaxID=2682976 RepID=A0A7K1TEE1_9BACT|nr:DUF433 domain-containing protein [Hymenobacter ginkgonis]
MLRTDLIIINPEIADSTPAFTGTWVSISRLVSYLGASHPLIEFLLDYPTVEKGQIKRVPNAAPAALLPIHLRVELAHEIAA